jgi:hypothetical protein
MTAYQRKPVPVHAARFESDGSNVDFLADWIRTITGRVVRIIRKMPDVAYATIVIEASRKDPEPNLMLHTLWPGYWIVVRAGTVEVMDDEAFHAIHEEVTP